MSSVARPAATVAVLRPSGDGFEVLLVRRSRAATFLADAFVFPGGRVEPADEVDGHGFTRAAVRELAEEAALTIAAEALIPFAHWITPSAEPKRFDTRFFVAPLYDATQIAHVDAQETTEHLWATPAALLDRHAHGALKLPPPTLHTLGDLLKRATLDDALSWARAQAGALVPILPKLAVVGDELHVVLPWDPEYPSLAGEGDAIATPRTPTRYALKDGHWRAL